MVAQLADHDKENVFLNSLTEQEYAEFVRNRNVGTDNKYGQSGLASEVLETNKHEEALQYAIHEQ